MKIRKGSINYLILQTIEKTVDGYVRLDDFINNSKHYALGDGRYLKKADLAYAIKKLREHGFVDTEVDEGKIIIKLTELGDDSIFPDTEKEWDGKHRIVIYDIPEEKRVVRDLFRRRLKDWKFHKWQQSIWITKLDVTHKMRKLISRLGIEQWVAIIESNDPVISTLTQRPLK